MTNQMRAPRVEQVCICIHTTQKLVRNSVLQRRYIKTRVVFYLLKKNGVQGSSRTAGLLRSELKVVGRRAGKIFILSVLLKYQQVQLMQGIKKKKLINTTVCNSAVRVVDAYCGVWAGKLYGLVPTTCRQ